RSARGVAFDRYGGGSQRGHVKLFFQSPKAALRAATRRPLSPAFKSVRARPRPVVAVLYPTRRNRSDLQDHEGRPEPAPDLPSMRTAHRGAHLRRVPRLLPARHATRQAQTAGAGPHAESRARQACRRADARCAFPYDSWPNLGHEPLHRIQRRPKVVGQTAQARSAATATPTNHSNSNNCSRPVVETYG